MRQQDPGWTGAAVHELFNQNFAEGTLITPGQYVAALTSHPSWDYTRAIWDVVTTPVRS